MLDVGNTAFMLVATALVMLMTPGLAFFYGGLVSRANVVAIMTQSFVSMGWTTFLWFAVGYSLTFSGDVYGVIGNLDHAFLSGVSLTEVTSTGIPLILFLAYQMMFAIITPALITGAFANRIRFSAYLVFLTAWLLCVYFPVAHMAWGGGLFSQWGVLDFAGGTVVHATAGFAALAAVLFVGRRRAGEDKPHSVPFVALGTALLWFGWYGFNAGSELAADGITALAFFNTDLAASVAGMAWLLMVWWHTGKPSLVGFLSGAVAGLVAITPAAGFVSPMSSLVIGLVAGLACYYAVAWRKRAGLDDALDVWGIHGIGGAVGVVLLGVLAHTAVNEAGADGLWYGGSAFFGVEVLSLCIAATWAFCFTYGALKLIDRFVTPVRVTEKEERDGLDRALHGEEAYY